MIPDWDETAFIRSYEKMTGAKVNEESLFYWKVFTAVKLSGIQIAAIKAGCESEVIHLQLLALFGIGVPAVVDVGARLLKF